MNRRQLISKILTGSIASFFGVKALSMQQEKEMTPNIVVSMPSQLFTLARKFQAASNGKIYIGKIDTYPTIPENQIQVYLENEDGSTIPVAQPLIINQAGYPVYNGQIAKFVTVEGHSMAVYDAYGVQQFYYSNSFSYSNDPSMEGRLVGYDSNLYKGSNGAFVKNGDNIPSGTTNITVLINGKPEDVSFAPKANGAVTNIGNKSARFGDVEIDFFDYRYEIENILAWKIGNRTDSEAMALARRFSPYRSQIIIPKGVWVSDSTEQQTYWGGGEVNKSDGSPNLNFIRANSGRTDATTCELYGVIRQNSPNSGWYFIEDSAHRKNGFSDEISLFNDDPYTLRIKYAFSARKVGNVNVTVDEWFAKAGVSVGNSVGVSEILLNAHKDAAFTVENQSLLVSSNGFFGDTITAKRNADSTITINHPSVLSDSDVAILSPFRPSDGVCQIPSLVSTTSTSITYALFSNLSGTIYHSNGSWKVDTSAHIAPVVSADSTGITISHPNLAYGITVVDCAADWGSASVLTQGQNTKIILRGWSGSVIDPTVSSDKFRIYFLSSSMTKQKTVIGGVSVFRSNVALKWDNIYGETGNLWIGGTMEV